VSTTNNKFLEMMASRQANPASVVVTENITSSNVMKNAIIVAVDLLTANPFQVRKVYNKQSLEELSADLKLRGILEPLIVRLTSDKNYQIVAGERRYRAAKLAGLREVPVIVKELDDKEARFITLVENIQRENLEAEDEARFFQTLEAEYNLTIKEMARLVNKSWSYVHTRLSSSTKRPRDLEQENNPEIVISRYNLAEKSIEVSKQSLRPNNFTKVWQKFNLVLDEIIFAVKTEPNREKTTELMVKIAELEQKLKQIKVELSETTED
jgi:ParB family transcriptional regulator, chromosome partitioning protein